MKGIGPRLREERERLGLTQRVFGDIGGVEPNAQGKYESGERTPRLDYLAALSRQGVDALYVVKGLRTPALHESLSPDEGSVLSAMRELDASDRAAVWHLIHRLAGDANRREPSRLRPVESSSGIQDALR